MRERSLIDIKNLQCKVALSRDQKAYKELFIHFYKPLMRFISSLVNSKEAAEEIYSDIMLKLWNMEACLEKIDNLKTYLYTSAKNASLNYLAKYEKVRTIDLETVDIHLEQFYNGQQDIVHAEFKRAAAMSIRSLPNKCQLVYLLIREYGFSYKEVATTLNISVNTVEGHMTTALKKLAVSLKPYLMPNNN